MSNSKLKAEDKAAIMMRATRAFVTEHADLKDGVAELGRLRAAAERRDPGSLITLTGPAGAGKTTIMRHFQRLERERIAANGREVVTTENGLVLEDGPNGDERPVVFVNTPSSRSPGAFAAAILRAYGAEVPRTLRKHQILDRLRAQIVGQKTQVLCIDEFHHAVAHGSNHVVWEISELVKDILVETRVQIVLCGMEEATLPVDANDQLDRRCRVRFDLEPFGWGETKTAQAAFCVFLADLEAAMALPKPSGLSDPVRAGRIHKATSGLVGRVTRLLQLAVEEGLERGELSVTDELMGWVYDRVKKSGNGTNPFAREETPAPKAGHLPPRRRAMAESRREDESRLTRLRGRNTGQPRSLTWAKRG